MSDALKQQAAAAALEFVPTGAVLGVGTGSTVNAFIALLPSIRHKIEACVSSSLQTTNALKALNFPVADANSVSAIDIYIDGADEVDPYKHLIKGGGAALTGEKIIAALSKKFICIVDERKCVQVLGKFPLPVEVIPLARSLVARKLTALGGHPVYREGVKTDYGNVILDVHHLDITDPLTLENTLKNLTGVVENGIFARNKADKVIVAGAGGVRFID